MEAVDREGQRRTAIGQSGQVWREIEARRFGVGPGGPDRWVEHPAAVIGFEAEPTYGLPGGGAARAAKTAGTAIQRAAAVAARCYGATVLCAVR